MAEDGRPGSFLRRLPRGVYWIVGGLIACIGAAVAKLLADQVPIEQRIPFWLVGSAIIFFGLYILSLGTKARLEKRDPDDGDPNSS